MNIMILTRDRQIRLPLHDRKRDVFNHTILQARKACRQLLNYVDTDRPRNDVKKLQKRTTTMPVWLQPAPETMVAERKRIIREYGWFAILKLKIKQPFAVRIGFPRERSLGLALMASVTAPLLLGQVMPMQGVTFELPDTPAAIATNNDVATPIGPKNWLDGIPESNGFRKDALSGPLKYAIDSDYEFAATEKRLRELVKEGSLVKLEETKSLKFNMVTRPYVLPMVAEFVYRLADQYNYDQHCGPLYLNGAARDVAFQKTLGNGSDKSVHPAGMAVDFKSTGLTPRCQTWLEQTLLEIEAAKRIDFTIERSPAHYHVAVATHHYETWLERRRTVADSNTDWLRKGIFYEGGPKETVEGFRAIGWVIRNRARSTEYPNTIEGVVAQGSVGEHNGKCHFSFMCDGKPEDRYELCRTESGELTSYWRHKCDMRWEKVTMIAKAVMSETNDPTGGAVLYYAAWMKAAPKWAIDMKRGTVNTIGSHVFGCSTKQGDDVCTKGASS